MDYATLKTNIKDICENEFTDAQLDMFTQQAEQKIYITVQFPAIRKDYTGACVVGAEDITMPADFLFPYSLAVVDAAGNWNYLLNKDTNFIREAYPNQGAAYRGLPKHYALKEASSTLTTIMVGPTPDATYTYQLNYGFYPESIVTAGTTWLGNNFDSALLNGALIEAIRFMKGEEADVSNYQKLYLQAIALLKTLGDGKLRQDAYRDGQNRVPVT